MGVKVFVAVAALAAVACSDGGEGSGERATTSPATTAGSGPSSTPSTPSTEPPSTTEGSTTTATVAATTTAVVDQLDADTVLHNGTVITLDHASTIASGLAIAGGRIVAVGDGRELLARSPGALAVDLDGRTVIPGIVDPHIHLEQNQTPDVDAMAAEEQLLVATGRTTLGVPAVIPINLEGYLALRESGRILLRSHLYLSTNDACGDVVENEGWWQAHDFDRSAELRLAIAGIKLFADGGSCNAPATSFRWVDGTNGDLYVGADDVADILRQADGAGALTVVHAIGDRAVEVALDGFDRALAGDNPNRHRIDHNTLVREDLVARYGPVGANFVGWAWFDSCLERTGNGWDSLGAGHLPWLRAHADVRAANADIAVAWHSDAPFSPTSVFEQLLGLTSFISLDDDGEPCAAPTWLAGNEVSVATALRMMTIEAAAAMDLDGDLGSIEIGKIADLAILANDPLAQRGTELLDNRVDSTWIDGRAAWCDGWSACDELPRFPGEGGSSDEVEVRASASRTGHGPELAVDGLASGESFWSSGDDPPGWIAVDFPAPRTLAGLRFTVYQNPPSDTVHVLELRVDGAWRDVERFAGFTATGDLIEWRPERPVEGVDGFRMTTIESASWPEWYEIEVVQ